MVASPPAGTSFWSLSSSGRRRPLIGVTGPDKGGEAAWLFTRLALSLAGASARHVTPHHPCCVSDFDGLIIGGGADVDPRLYGQELAPMLKPTSETRQPLLTRILEILLLPLTWLIRQLLARSSDERQDTARDKLEWTLIEQAMARGLPVLGICRGAQLLNVYFGGSLHQSLSGYYVETPQIRSIRPRKRIEIRSGTRLFEILTRPARWVNSLHRQAVNRLGAGLRIAAADANGIVQAIEHETLPFMIGVQWHPEYLLHRREQRAIFRALVRAARAKATAATAH